VRERSRWIKDADGEPELESGVQQRTVKNAPIHGNTIHDWVRQYHQSVLAIDEAVGRLREALRETKQLEDTVIVFAADQGIAWGQHGFQQKVAPYDANIRGPLIFSYPKKLATDKVCSIPVGGTDIPPTLFGLVDLPLPWKMHGHDLQPLLIDPQHAWPHPVLTVMTGECYGSDTDVVPTDPDVLYKAAKVPWWISLVQGNYKYIRTLVEGEVEELYDLKNDPEELSNLALSIPHNPRLKAMRAAAIAELRRTGAKMADGLPSVGTE
jgi:arylsulfatase A-like enzyme